MPFGTTFRLPFARSKSVKAKGIMKDANGKIGFTTSQIKLLREK